MATCPSCDKQELRHALLANNLAVLGCNHCKGALVSLVSYRHWIERNPAQSSSTPSAVSADDSRHALVCPKCKSVMNKYLVSSAVPNRIDYCAHCEEIWLDNGEWQLVEDFARSGHLTTILTRPWQRRIRQEIAHDMETKRLHDLLGADYQRFEDLQNWLEAHPHRDEIIAHLQQRNR